MTSHQFHRFPGPHQQCITLAKFRKNMPGKIYRSIGDRNRILANGGIGAHTFGNRENPWKQSSQFSPHRAGLTGYSICGFKLAKYLRFAQHHGIQPAGHLHHMLQRLLGLKVIGRMA